MESPELLTGYRILDLAGPAAVLTSRLLADLGADVIRIETSAVDEVRRRAPLLADGPTAERSLYHHHFNRNKRSLTLDLSQQDDRETFVPLSMTADALIETRAPGEMDALGLGYRTLAEMNPGLVYTTVTPFGQEGPFAHYRGNDLIGAASSGFLYLNGFPDAPPYRPGGEQAFKMAALVAAASTLMALVGRDSDPERRGRRVDVSVQEAASMATTQTANANIYTWHGRIPRRMGNMSGLQKCKDGKWISFVLRTGTQDTWREMADWLRDEDIETPVLSEEWRDERFRVQNRQPVTKAIADLCAKYDRDYIFHEGQRRKQLVMPVNNVADLLDDEQMRHRDYFIAYEHDGLGSTLTDSGLPYRFNNVTSRPHRRAPLLGEHNASILEELSEAPARPKALNSGQAFSPTQPLAGIRVADFSWMIAGPAASRVLADFGAEVIKIESQYRVDNIRAVGVQPPGEGSLDTNGVFNDQNTNKLSLRLNVNNPRGLDLVKEIIKGSDVVLNNYTAERMPRWGLGYEDLRKIKDDIILLSMPVMGCSGPYRQYGSYGNGVIAYGGLNSISGYAGTPPVGLGPLYSDFAGPYLVVSAIMAALLNRTRTGAGQFIDFAQVEATASLLGPAFLEYTTNGKLPERLGNRSQDVVPHGVYLCAGEDRWCAIAAQSDEEWCALASVLGRQELGSAAGYASAEARRANEDEIDALISAWTREHDVWQVMHVLQAQGVTAAVVEDLEDMCVRDPWLSTRHLASVPFEEAGIEYRTHNQPVRMNGELPALKRSPRFGEHSMQVLGTLLGLSASEIEELLIEEVVF
jgi:crotonobetainyl-CoA:carnitine CoA-transferase CaiB-like acyl-CoA transferase